MRRRCPASSGTDEDYKLEVHPLKERPHAKKYDLGIFAALYPVKPHE